MASVALRERLAQRIRREGPIPFDQFVEAALYDDAAGFFSRGGGAGRAGRDFVTSPEVGVLFGALVARALDAWWDALGEPDPFVVVDAGAGRGRLAADILRAHPRATSALRYVLVERSAALRDRQRELLAIEPFEDTLGPSAAAEPDQAPLPVPGVGPIVGALAELPAVALDGVVLANELLDNLPFRLVERSSDAWTEVRVGLGDDGSLVEVTIPAPSELAAAADDLGPGMGFPPGARLPIPTGTAEWVADAGRMLRRGFLVVVDYVDDVASLAHRGQASWLRTYRGHERGAEPLADPGGQDITCDVVADHLVGAAQRAGFRLLEQRSQAEWLDGLGIGELVGEARTTWRDRAAIGDLEAMAARSRIHEADALTDPGGLGAHTVYVFAKGALQRGGSRLQSQ